MEVVQEHPVIRCNEDVKISVNVGVSIVIILTAAATTSANTSAYKAGLKAIFGVAPYEALLAAHPPPPQCVPIAILPRPDPLGNKNGPGGEDDGRINAN